jgi:RNA polymerase sigma factor (sigma-70 family)
LPVSFSNKDQLMAEAFHRGDETGLNYIHDQFFPALSLFAFKIVENDHVAQDIASEALVKTWKMHYKLDSFGAIRAYLYKIVHRDSIAAIKKKRRRAEVEESGGLLTSIISIAPSDRIIQSEVYRIVHNAIKELPPGSRRVLEKYYFEDMTAVEIANDLGVHVSTIKTQKQRGLKALKEKLSHLSEKGFFKNNFIAWMLTKRSGLRKHWFLNVTNTFSGS